MRDFYGAVSIGISRDFGQTALSSLQFFKGSFADASNFRIKDRPQ